MSYELHYWASGMRPEAAQKYLNDLCGSESQHYTEDPREVTCERCIAALRAGRGAPGTQPQGETESPVPPSAQIAVEPNGVLDRAVRAAVLKERQDIIEIAQAMRALDGNADYRTALRQLIDEVKRRD